MAASTDPVTPTAPTAPTAPTGPTTPAAPGGLLRSNVGTLEAVDAPRRRPSVLVPALILGTLLILLIAVVALFASFRAGSQPTAARAQPTPILLSTPTQAPGAAASARRSSSGVAAPLPAINDISCDALEATIFHIHVHLAIFINGNEQQVPFGIGIGQPWQVEDSDEGPFVTDGSCFYWIHTHTEDGVIHIESPTRRTFTLGDFFAIWQQTLSASQVGPVQGTVITYVNGTRDETNPPDIRLLSHQRIQLDVGQDVPPYAFDFPPGD
jgi:hypothetical protein